MPNARWFRIRIWTFASVVLSFWLSEAMAVDRYWVGPPGGLWSNPGNWSATPGGIGGAGVPQTGDVANAPDLGISASFDFAYSQPGVGLTLGSPNIQQNDPLSSLVAFNDLFLPRFQQPSGTGRWTQTAGNNILNRNLQLGQNSQNPTSFTQGFYTLGGNATLNIGTSLFATNGNFTQTGGLCTITEHIELGDFLFNTTGEINMSGGTLNVARAIALKVGACTFSGGETTVGQYIAIAFGNVTLSGGRISAGSIAMTSAAINTQIFQTGGSMLVTNQVNVGTHSTYRYNGGSFSCATLNIGNTSPNPGVTAQFLVGPGTDIVVRTRAINIFPMGKLDVNQAAAVVDHEGSSPLASIRAQIVSGYNNGSWNGNGIISSFAAANAGHGVGYAEASAIFAGFPAMFRGHQVDGTTVLIATTRLGDADLNDIVNLNDFNRLAANFGTPSGAVWSQADFNYDGSVNLSDFNLLAANFGLAASPGGPTPEDWSTLAAAVPEPGMSAWLLLAPIVAHRRRKFAVRW